MVSDVLWTMCLCVCRGFVKRTCNALRLLYAKLIQAQPEINILDSTDLI